MDVITLSRVLKHYKRPEIQQAIVDFAQHKEAVASYGGKGYGKRPDTLVFPNDVFELVKSGATSFHISEETWANPQEIVLNMKKQEYDKIRIGWDLVLDIDCPHWEFAKITAWLFIRSLQEHGIRSVTAKFSGNKGFHIAVPFEAFPEKIKNEETKNLFPDGPRKIAAYLLDYIAEKHVRIEDDSVVFGGRFSNNLHELTSKTGKTTDELVKEYCKNCGKKIKHENTKKTKFICPQCERMEELADASGDEYRKCAKCGVFMEKATFSTGKKCCARPAPERKFDPLAIVDVDTVLIAPRHLYRAPFSYHEKSGLVSVPIDPDKILEFEKVMADPAAVKVGQHPFMDRETAKQEEGTNLLMQALDCAAKKEQQAKFMEEIEKSDIKKEFEEILTAIPEQFFPPCIQSIAKGIPDGKKRAVFILTNFLASCGWTYDNIEDWLKKWNLKNPEPLRDQNVLGHVRYTKQLNKKVLPPNCDNTAYYKSFGVCKPDNFCKYVKNPANYAIKRARNAQGDEGKRKKEVKSDHPSV
jgi:DNA primase catalytic subunit